MNISASKTPKRPVNFLFFLLILIESARCLYMIAGHRLVVHDTFYRFSMQYYLFNSQVQSGHWPHWIPYLTHGTTAHWWHAMQGVTGFFFYVACLAGGLLKSIPYEVLFNAGIYVDRLVLLTGSWLLGKKLFQSQAAIFCVCLSLLGASVWESQSYFNIHFYYALPLVMYWGHQFLETSRWRYAVGFFNLYALQAAGNASYFIPVTSFAFFIYFLAYGLTDKEAMRKWWRTLDKQKNAAFAMLIIVLSLAAVYALLRFGQHDNLVLNLTGRDTVGQVEASSLQNHATKGSLARWIEILLGFSVDLDYTVYFGLLGAFLLPVSFLARPVKKIAPVVTVILFLSLLAGNTWVTAAAYAVWPLMSYIRHLDLLIAFIKLFVILLAGFGFDYLFRTRNEDIRWKFIAGVVAVFALLAAGVYYVSMDAGLIRYWAGLMHLNPILKDLAHYPNAIKLLVQTASWRLAGLVALCAWLVFCARTKNKTVLMTVVLLVHLCDLGFYSMRETARRTIALAPDQLQYLTYTPLPYNPRRTTETFYGNRREQFLRNHIPFPGAHYWTLNAFLFNDRVGTHFRTDHWLKSYDDFLRAVTRPVPGDDGTYPPWAVEFIDAITFPSGNTAAMKLAGVTADKIQFFSRAYWLEDENRLRDILRNNQFSGDLLFLSGEHTDSGQPNAHPTAWPEDLPLAQSDRIALNYEVTYFDSDTLAVTVANTSAQPAWLFYSDTWHRSWLAWNNESPSTVFKAALGFKAVRLNPGINRVRFLFHTPWINPLLFLISLNCLFWLAYLISKIIAEIIGDSALFSEK